MDHRKNLASGPAILVTGGAGYVGAHTAKALAERGYIPIVFDNLSSGHREAVRWGPFVHGDIRDSKGLFEVMEIYKVQAVIHFASLIEVGRSVARPDLFWEQNLTGSANLLAVMKTLGVTRLVFSSSAAVYGQPNRSALQAIVETDTKDPSSPYGDTKLACERLIAAHAKAFGMTTIALRYFNASGADPSGLIGEAHHPETHLIPLAIASALSGKKPLTVFGDDFDTPDGTCIRDYIHVSDLAQAHIAALESALPVGAFEAVNVGAGHGHSVTDVLKAVGRVSGRPVPFIMGKRRPGDPPGLVADPSLAKELFGWSARNRISTRSLRMRIGGIVIPLTVPTRRRVRPWVLRQHKMMRFKLRREDNKHYSKCS